MNRNTKIFASTVIAIIALFLLTLVFSQKLFGQESRAANCSKFVYHVGQEDGERIREIITTMGKTGTVGLLFKRSHLKKLGNEVDKRVPPLEFLAFIFSDRELSNYMAKIQKSGFKYNGFLEGLQKNLITLNNSGCLMIKADGFAKYLGIDPAKTKQLLGSGVNKAKKNDNKAFKDFVNYLIAEKGS